MSCRLACEEVFRLQEIRQLGRLDPSVKHNGLGADTGALCQIVTKIPVVLSGIVEDIQSQSHELPLVTHTIGLANEYPHKRSGFLADERQRLPAALVSSVNVSIT
jgi:hypothetical protein